MCIFNMRILNNAYCLDFSLVDHFLVDKDIMRQYQLTFIISVLEGQQDVSFIKYF